MATTQNKAAAEKPKADKPKPKKKSVVVAIKNHSGNSIEIHQRTGAFTIRANDVTPVTDIDAGEVERVLEKYKWLEAVTK